MYVDSFHMTDFDNQTDCFYRPTTNSEYFKLPQVSASNSLQLVAVLFRSLG